MNNRCKRVISFALALVMVISTCLINSSIAYAQNRYYYVYETTPVKSKVLSWTSEEPRTRKDDTKAVAAAAISYIPLLGNVYSVVSLGNELYSMNTPGMLKASYYYKTKYKCDRLNKQKKTVAGKWEYITLTLYKWSTKERKYIVYTTKSHTLNLSR